MIDPTAFQRYRDSAGSTATLPRLALGIVLIVACWVAVTFAALFGGFEAARRSGAGIEGMSMQQFAASASGTLSVFASFAGIWIGVWLAMRLLHRQPVARLFGVSGRLSASGFGKGLAAVLLTSAFSELALYAIAPGIGRAPVPLSTWALALIPVSLLAFVQTGAEELLFRGYLLRGLARRFASPLVWGLLPGLAFTLLHWSGGANVAMTVCLLVSIGCFAALLTLIVYATGNLGAAIGAHFGNNITGFLLISHESNFSAFALFAGTPLKALDWSAGMAAYVTLTGIVSCLLTALLLFHPRSPLKLAPDRAPPSEVPAEAPPVPLQQR